MMDCVPVIAAAFINKSSLSTIFNNFQPRSTAHLKAVGRRPGGGGTTFNHQLSTF
jgi:hypothetical protein